MNELKKAETQLKIACVELRKAHQESPIVRSDLTARIIDVIIKTKEYESVSEKQ